MKLIDGHTLSLTILNLFIFLFIFFPHRATAQKYIDGKKQSEIIITRHSPLVGAIRWDGWVGKNGSWQIGPIVERTLGPAKFHYRAPFFSQVISTDSLFIDGTTQEIMDLEIAYAKDAGIDYWAYCWYPDGCGLELARKFHQTSSDANDVKWCVVLGAFEENVFNSAGLNLISDFTRENYQKVLDDRPLIYLYGSDLTKAGLNKLRSMAMAKNLKNPYVVVMDWSAGSASDYCNQIGADAISSYAALGNNNRPFAEVIPPKSISDWDAYAAKKEIVPWVCTGWNTKPRMESENPWKAYYSDATNCQDATANDIKEFLISAIDWTQSNKSKAIANTIIVYAWNEHDEGYGAICPTLGSDTQPDTERLDSVKSALRNRIIDSTFIRSYQLEVIVLEDNTNNPVQGSEVKVNSITIISDNEGITSFPSVPESFSLSISNTEYQPVINKYYTIHSDTSLIVYVLKRNLNVTISVIDEKTLLPVKGVSIVIGPSEFLSDIKGQVNFSIPAGFYQYTLSKTSYLFETGGFSLSSDTGFTVHLIRTHAEIKFRLRDGTTPLNNFTVKVNNDSLLTNSLGIAIFKQIPIDQTYNYLISGKNYINQEGEFFLDSDKVFEIGMVRNFPDYHLPIVVNDFKVWPNPTSGQLNCTFHPDLYKCKLIILNSFGMELFRIHSITGDITLDMNDFPAGMYILQVSGNFSLQKLFFIYK